ncbi:caspase-3 [Pelobates cultripes]|uniref:Caspase-3 n=1 Tax=Pelobates cultripes TaxID=61616 RepID=A0AAD1SID7_PELCU|nr:caspase-3 [Pelobates cultripes]
MKRMPSFGQYSAPKKKTCETKQWLSQYNMDFPRMGLCLLIDVNQNDDKTCLSQPQMREDLQTAKNTFESLGFKVKIEPIKTLNKVLSLLKDVAKEDHSENSCFVCIILIHETDLIFDKYDSRQFTEGFTGDKCRTLVGKPKIFFILGTKGEDMYSFLETDSNSNSKITKIPAQGDFLYVSFISSGKKLDPKHWYLKNLCTMLLEYGHTTSLVTIITHVNGLTAQQYEAFGLDDPAFLTTMLTKAIVFPRKIDT